MKKVAGINIENVSGWKLTKILDGIQSAYTREGVKAPLTLRMLADKSLGVYVDNWR